MEEIGCHEGHKTLRASFLRGEIQDRGRGWGEGERFLGWSTVGPEQGSYGKKGGVQKRGRGKNSRKPLITDIDLVLVSSIAITPEGQSNCRSKKGEEGEKEKRGETSRNDSRGRKWRWAMRTPRESGASGKGRDNRRCSRVHLSMTF